MKYFEAMSLPVLLKLQCRIVGGGDRRGFWLWDFLKRKTVTAGSQQWFQMFWHSMCVCGCGLTDPCADHWRENFSRLQQGYLSRAWHWNYAQPVNMSIAPCPYFLPTLSTAGIPHGPFIHARVSSINVSGRIHNTVGAVALGPAYAMTWGQNKKERQVLLATMQCWHK